MAIQLSCIRIGELAAWLDSEAFNQLKVLPISRRRGRAHARNPRARKEDVALVLAWRDDQLVGYLGLIPDLIFQDQQSKEVSWMSCIWVDPEARGQGIARQLLERAYTETNQRLLATEFTAPARRLYDKLGWFDELAVKHGQRLYLRLHLAQILPARSPSWCKWRPALQFLDATFNVFYNLRLRLFDSKLPADCRYELIEQWDEACWPFIALHQNSLTQRDRSALEWVVQNPWLGDQPEDQADAARYHFSVYSTDFSFQVLKLWQAEQLRGIALIGTRDCTLKIPYLWSTKGAESLMRRSLIDLMIKNNWTTMTLYQPEMVTQFQQHRTPFLFQKAFERAYLITKPLTPHLPAKIYIQDGDGDCAFT